LAEAYESLDSLEVRDVSCDGFSILIQFNPKRMISTNARVDEDSVRARKCFLCPDNLPDEQKGVLYRDDFLVLCNPAPIFSRHYTISTVQHVPQEIGKFISTLLSLSKELSPEFTLFYNGPRCGASAPDHMHFQASPSRSIPVEKDAENVARRVLLKKEGPVSFITLRNYGRRVVLLESEDEGAIEAAFLNFMRSMKKVVDTLEEPMINLLCSFQQKAWRIIIFPRRKHRPDVYFAEGGDRVLISPAAVDIGGLIITPVERDFQNADAVLIENIFNEVCVGTEVFDEIVRGA